MYFHKPVFTAVHKRINDDNSTYYWAKYDRKPQSNLVYPQNAPLFTSKKTLDIWKYASRGGYDVVVMTDGSTPNKPPYITDRSTSDVIEI